MTFVAAERQWVATNNAGWMFYVAARASSPQATPRAVSDAPRRGQRQTRGLSCEPIRHACATARAARWPPAPFRRAGASPDRRC